MTTTKLKMQNQGKSITFYHEAHEAHEEYKKTS